MYFPKFEWPRVVNPKLKFTHGKITEETIAEVKVLIPSSLTIACIYYIYISL